MLLFRSQNVGTDVQRGRARHGGRARRDLRRNGHRGARLRPVHLPQPAPRPAGMEPISTSIKIKYAWLT